MNKKTNKPQTPPLPDKPIAAKVKRRYFAVAGTLTLCLCCATPALAAGDPLAVVNNLSDFIFACIKAIGVIGLGWGVVQIGLSTQTHDVSQRLQGLLCFFGGLIIAFAKDILVAIGAV